MQARAHRSLHPFDTSIAHLRDYFERLRTANSVAGARPNSGSLVGGATT